MKLLSFLKHYFFEPVPDRTLPFMDISKDHILEIAREELLPGGSAMNTRRFLVIHFTGGWTAQSSVDYWKTPAAQGACAHVIIDRDGKIIQCRPFNRTAGHAGVSKWHDKSSTFTSLNSCAIGIELANCGDLVRATYPDTMGDLAGKVIPRISARHKNGGPIKQWEVFPEAQLSACFKLALALKLKYNLDDVIGHEDIAPERKNDPGPAFPMDSLRVTCGFPAKIS